MEAEVDVREVRRVETRSGSTRFVLEDGHGNEYTTFREGIGEAAEALAGRRAVITFHEEERGRYRNVYLDSVAPSQAETEASASTGEANEADEVGWRTAIEASPWLLGRSEPDREVPPEEFFDKLKPFKELVSEDIKEGEEEQPGTVRPRGLAGGLFARPT
jgi:hypothetical protein